MASCLGIYIESNLIKYAKVSKNHNDLKIESFGVRFYENLNEEIDKIIEETYSFGVPVSINLMNEQYLYFDIFALLNQKDIKKSVETELENYCDEKKLNVNAFETRYALVSNVEDKDKLQAINILANKIEFNRQLQGLSKYKVTNVMPLPMTITNLTKFDKKDNTLIINMDETTTITTIINSQIYEVEILDVGSKEVLEDINKIENSYSKAYEICKNTTIYTADIQGEEGESVYLQYMVPVLYKINQKVQEIMGKYTNKFQTVYLTGALANINNVDLYFQEFLPSSICKILKPHFLENISTQINIKDYVEVNSAISLALSGLGEGVQGINFKKVALKDKLSTIMNMEIGKGGGKKTNKEPKVKKESKIKAPSINMDFNLKGSLDKAETIFVRSMISVALVTIIFIAFSIVLGKQMSLKEKEIDGLIAKQTEQISKIDGDNQKLNSKITKYSSLISDLEKINERISDIAASKDSIPNLLNQIMFCIPDAVQLTSIQNTSDRHIKIEAQSAKYEQLGYFVAKLKNKGYLLNVISSSGAKSNDNILITIEGDLP